MGSISVAIMAHPAREQMVAQLIEQLGIEPQVAWDGGWEDEHPTGLMALRMFDPAASHHVVLQDDVVPCRDLISAIGLMTWYSKEHPIGLYVGSTPYDKAVNRSLASMRGHPSPWWAGTGPKWGPGIVVPTAHVPDLTAWFEQQDRIDGYDRRITRWYMEQDIDCWYTRPSLVDHRDEPSLLKNRPTAPRKATHFLSTDQSALELDWSIPPPEWELCPHDQRAIDRCVHCGRY